MRYLLSVLLLIFSLPALADDLDVLYPTLDSPFDYKLNQVNRVKGAVYKQQQEPTGGLNYKNGDFSLTSSSTKGKSDYMRDTFGQKTEARVNKKYFEFATGMETKYESPDASKYSSNMFLAPKLKLGNRFSLLYDGRVNPLANTAEQSVGVNYRPKYLKNTSFGVYSGATYRSGAEQSQKTKFISDFYLW